MTSNQTIHPDQYVLDYQATGISDPLIKQFKNFLNKYSSMISNENIDFSNYDVRSFLSCYVKEREIKSNLKRGRFHSSKTVETAYRVLRYVKWALRKHKPQEVEAEILIPFLRCARSYQQKGKTFSSYLYQTYRYELKRHIDSLTVDILDQEGVLFFDVWHDDYDWEVVDIDSQLLQLDRFNLNDLEMDEGLELSHPDWIHKDKSLPPFDTFKSHERYILVKYYYENYTDKEIARMLPYNPKSIHRIRMRLVNQLMKMYQEGELRWIRLPK